MRKSYWSLMNYLMWLNVIKSMKMRKNVLATFVLFGMTLISLAQVSDKELSKDYRKEIVSSADLASWSFYGQGKAFDEGRRQFCITEAEQTKGAMVVSPKSYSEHVVVRYKTMTLTPSAVLVAILSASNDENGQLVIPAGYDGGMPLWMKDIDNYFFAFRNAPHNFTPFVRKYPKPGNVALASAKENVLHPGVYYDVEVGRSGNTLWLKVDGQLLFKATDASPLKGGHIAFRTRGTAGYKAACLIKELEIYSK
jgi:hypothetical protein